MKDKIELLMEETGCDRGEAELALEMCGFDLEEAVRQIPRLLNDICALKGKFWTTVLGMFVPFVGVVGAIRLGRPSSPWARRFYKPDGRKLARAKAREERHERRWQRLQDLIGGAPSLPSPRDLTHRGDRD